MARGVFRLGAQTFTLSHLRGVRLLIPAKDPLQMPALLQVTFSTHVFSEKWNAAKHDAERRFEDKGDTRAFCPVRYGCSILLPDILKQCVGGKAHVGRDGNGHFNHFFYAIADGIPYPVYFRLAKANRIKGVDGILHIISAYQRPGMKPRHKFQAIKFARLVHQICPPAM
jgi:hypothetical protein